MSVSKVEIYKYYPVTGKTKEELIASLNENAPAHNGQKYRGYTSWSITHVPKIKFYKGKYILDKYSVHLKSVITLPIWRLRTGSTSELKTMFDNYVDCLKRHEMGHLNIALSAAHLVNSEALKLQGQDTDMDLLVNIEDLMRLICSGMKVVESNYDQATKHGRTQGAHLE